MKLIENFPATAVAAVILLAPIGHDFASAEGYSRDSPEVAAPFRRSPKVVLFPESAQTLYLKQRYLTPSMAHQSPVSFRIEANERSPAELVQELRRLAGLTWMQIAEVFEVSSRAPFDWASGKPVAAKNHQRLGEIVATLRFVDRGSSEENRNLLLSDAEGGRTYLDLLRGGQVNLVKDLAGKGAGRPLLERQLTADAEKLNSRAHFGSEVLAAAEAGEVEPIPQNLPELRKAKARRRKA
jgi:hypothetical protein